MPSISAAEVDEAETTPLAPLPTLPPVLRDGPAIPGVQASDDETNRAPTNEPTRAIDRASLVADINALRQDVARVRRSLESQDPQFSQAFERTSQNAKHQPANHGNGYSGRWRPHHFHPLRIESPFHPTLPQRRAPRHLHRQCTN